MVWCLYHTRYIIVRMHEKMELSAESVRVILRYEYLNKAEVKEAFGKLWKAFMDSCIGQSTCYERHRKFASEIRELSVVLQCS